jgi:hypothetical protein
MFSVNGVPGSTVLFVNVTKTSTSVQVPHRHIHGILIQLLAVSKICNDYIPLADQWYHTA